MSDSTRGPAGNPVGPRPFSLRALLPRLPCARLVEPMTDAELTQVIRRIGEGEAGAWDEAVALVYAQLKVIAHRFMLDQAGGHTLQTTALVHEVYIKLAGNDRRWESRRHFELVAARAMRQVLVDHARARQAAKRGGGQQVQELRGDELGDEPRLDDGLTALALHESLERLQSTDPDAAKVAELRCFGGLQIEEIAKVLEWSERTVERRWRAARDHLRSHFGGPDPA